MKPTPIEIRAGDLKPVVAGLGKLISRKAALPALQCVKADTPKPDILRLTATDLSLTLAVEIPVKTAQRSAPFLVPIERLRDLVRHAQAGEVLRLAPVASAPALDQFPAKPAWNGLAIALPDSAAAGLVRAFQCASGDTTRHVLQGAFLDTSGKGSKAHRIVGTDGRHLFSSNSLHLPKVKTPVILPDHPLWQWKPIAESRPWSLCLGTPEKDGPVPFRIQGPAWSITGHTIDGNYPNYRQVMPKPEEFQTQVTLSDTALEAIVRLIPRLPGKRLSNRPVGLHLEKGRLGLLARETNDEPWVLHPIDTVKGKGPDLCTFVNRDYLRKAAEFGLGEIALIDAMSPLRFSREGDLMIVMPIRAINPERIERPKLEPAVKSITSSPRNRSHPKPATPAKPAPPARKKVAPKPARKLPDRDPIDEVESRIAEANEALVSAGKQLHEATGSLKTARRQRGEDREELQGLRSLFSSIRKFATGSN